MVEYAAVFGSLPPLPCARRWEVAGHWIGDPFGMPCANLIQPSRALRERAEMKPEGLYLQTRGSCCCQRASDVGSIEPCFSMKGAYNNCKQK